MFRELTHTHTHTGHVCLCARAYFFSVRVHIHTSISIYLYTRTRTLSHKHIQTSSSIDRSFLLSIMINSTNLGEGDIDPAGEAVLLVPLALAVAHKHKRVVPILVKPRVAVASHLRRRRPSSPPPTPHSPTGQGSAAQRAMQAAKAQMQARRAPASRRPVARCCPGDEHSTGRPPAPAARRPGMRGTAPARTACFTKSRGPPPRRARLEAGAAAAVRRVGMRPLPQVAGVAPCAAAIARSDKTNTRIFALRCDLGSSGTSRQRSRESSCVCQCSWASFVGDFN